VSEVIVRPVGDRDIPAIAAIYAEQVLHGTATFEVEPPEEAEIARRVASMVDGGYPCLVAARGDSVIGYGYAGPYRTRAAYWNTVEDSIYLAADSRGQGVGGTLLGALIVECDARRFRQMVAVIGDSRNTASIALHRSAGFQMAGMLTDVGYKHGRWLNTILMQRALGPGAREEPARP
jgi:phosphinothricin acetyltransferase